MLFFINIKNRGTIKEYISATIKYNINTASILTFTILQNSPFFNNLNKYIDKVEVVDFNNNKIFDGRVLNVEKSMNNKGEFINQVTCESVLNYLVDITVPIWNFYSGSVPQKAPSGSVGNTTIQYVLQQVLNTYNEGALIKINLGNVTVNGNVTLKTNRQTCLQVITQALIKNFGGYIQIREENNQYYLDYLINPPILNTATNFAIGVNIQSLSISDSLSSMCTRLIGIGKTETLQAIAENESLIKTYGIIDKVIHFKDITDLSELQTRVNEEIKNINTDVLNASIGALDLSYINDDFNRLQLYQPITITCNELTYMQEHYIASITLDLLKPYSSTFQLNTNTVNQVPQLAQVIASNKETTKAILEVNGTLNNTVSQSEFTDYKKQIASTFNSQTIVSSGITKPLSNGESIEITIPNKFQSLQGEYDFIYTISNVSGIKGAGIESISIQVISEDKLNGIFTLAPNIQCAELGQSQSGGTMQIMWLAVG